MPEYKLSLSGDEAIVLFEWIIKYNSSRKEVLPAEEVVLSDIESQLESLLVEPFEDGYAEILENARSSVLRG